MYETIPDFKPGQAQTKEEPKYNVVKTYEKAQTYERVQSYEKIHHNDAEMINQILSGSTCEKLSGTELEEVSSKV